MPKKITKMDHKALGLLKKRVLSVNIFPINYLSLTFLDSTFVLKLI